MTRQELHALVDAHYEPLAKLQEHYNFYDFEKDFDQIWTQLGQQVLQASVGEASQNPRKKTIVKPATGPSS